MFNEKLIENKSLSIKLINLKMPILVYKDFLNLINREESMFIKVGGGVINIWVN